MITKAIVEDILSEYQVRVRVPTIDRMNSSGVHTNSSDLTIATICSLPNCYINLQRGDIVIVAFEDNSYDTCVVLGHLSRSAYYESLADLSVRSVNIKDSVKLPSDTTIGDLTSANISSLQGIRDNIQKQLDSLQEQIIVLQNALLTQEEG